MNSLIQHTNTVGVFKHACDYLSVLLESPNPSQIIFQPRWNSGTKLTYLAPVLQIKKRISIEFMVSVANLCYLKMKYGTCCGTKDQLLGWCTLLPFKPF